MVVSSPVTSFIHPTTLMPDYQRRLDSFRTRLEAVGVSAAFLPESADLEYLTGVPRARHVSDPAWDAEVAVEGCFIGLRGTPVFLFTHSEWSLPAAAAVEPYEVMRMPPTDNPVDWLRRAARTVGANGTVGLGDRVPFSQVQALHEALADTHLVTASEYVLELRLCKEDEEIHDMRAACAIALRALEATLPRFGASFTRGDFLRELEHQLIGAGSERVAYAPDLYAVGPHTSVVWSSDALGSPNAPIRAPASVTVDYGAVWNGYRSDIGRTIYVGEPPSGQEDALRVVRIGQEAAIAALRPGVPAEDVDRAAREILENAGLGDAFWIPSGHGIGLEIHEPPRLRAGIKDPVPERATVTVEIAAWREATTAAFWEDDVVVWADGAEKLSTGFDEPYVIA